MYPEGFFQSGEELPGTDGVLHTEVGWIDDYRMVYQQLPTNWFVYSPDVDGIFATGPSRADVERRMREALPDHLAVSDEPLGVSAP